MAAKHSHRNRRLRHGPTWPRRGLVPLPTKAALAALGLALVWVGLLRRGATPATSSSAAAWPARWLLVGALALPAARACIGVAGARPVRRASGLAGHIIWGLVGAGLFALATLPLGLLQARLVGA